MIVGAKFYIFAIIKYTSVCTISWPYHFYKFYYTITNFTRSGCEIIFLYSRLFSCLKSHHFKYHVLKIYSLNVLKDLMRFLTRYLANYLLLRRRTHTLSLLNYVLRLDK